MYNNYYVNYNLLYVDDEDKLVTTPDWWLVQPPLLLLFLLQLARWVLGSVWCILVNHSTFRMLQVYIFVDFLEIWVGFLQLHVFVACGVVNKFYGQQVIATDVFLKVFILDLQTVCGYSYICIYVNYENVFKW